MELDMAEMLFSAAAGSVVPYALVACWQWLNEHREHPD